MHALLAFLEPVILALLCFVACLFGLAQWYEQNLKRPAALLYSDIRPLKPLTAYGKVRFLRLPFFLLLTALAALLLAWWNPPLPITKPLAKEKIERPPLPTEGAAFYLLLDRSSSMDEVSPFAFPPKRKIDLLKAATSHFIGGAHDKEGQEELIDTSQGSSDLIGIIAFARSPQVLAPLTLDRVRLQDLLAHLQVVRNEEEDGTGIGYAIFKAVQLIAATKELSQKETAEKRQNFHINNAFLIILTDGFQDPNPLDQGKRLRTMGLEEAAHYAKHEGVKVYIINMQAGFDQPMFAPHRHLLESITQLTGGQFFLLSQTQDLDSLYTMIRQREQTLLPLGTVVKEPSTKGRQQSGLVPYLLILALICMISSTLSLATTHRMVP